jgi:hypothetical protein
MRWLIRLREIGRFERFQKEAYVVREDLRLDKDEIGNGKRCEIKGHGSGSGSGSILRQQIHQILAILVAGKGLGHRNKLNGCKK